MRKIERTDPTTGVDWVEEFASSIAGTDLSPKTVAGYRQDLELFRRWFDDIQSLDSGLGSLSAIDLMSYRQHLSNVERLKPTTINRRMQALRKFCKWAERSGKLKADPSSEVKGVRLSPRRQPLGLKQRDVHAMLRAAGESGHGHAKRNYALVQLFLQTGIRLKEAASMCVADVTIRARNGSMRVREGKGRREREIPLNATARRALREYLEARESTKPDDPLFESGRDTQLSRRSIQNMISQLARRAKIKRLEVSPHTLRHTFALSYLRDNPGKLVELANLLGHDSLDTTAVYTQPSSEDLARDLERSSLNVYDD